MRTRNIAYISSERETLVMFNFLERKGINNLYVAREAKYLMSGSYVSRKGIPKELMNKIRWM